RCAQDAQRQYGSALLSFDTPTAGGGVEESRDSGEYLGLVEQEGVIPAVGFDLHERDVRGRGIQRMHDGPVLRRREKPVGGEGDDAETGLSSAKSVGEDAAVVEREVEVIHGPRHVEIRVCVEPADESRALVAQVRLHLEIRVETEGELCPVLQLTPEFPVQ